MVLIHDMVSQVKNFVPKKPFLGVLTSSDTDLTLQGELRSPSLPVSAISSCFGAFLGMAEVQNWSLTALPWEIPVPKWAGIKGREMLDAQPEFQQSQ